MNTFRVDRSDNGQAPCGMNSIRYIGDSRTAALAAFQHLLPGLDAWDQPNSKYGVVLSQWTGTEYITLRTKP